MAAKARPLTRVGTKGLEAARDSALKDIRKARATLEKYLPILTEAERPQLLRPSPRFPAASERLAEAIAEAPSIATTTGYDVSAVREDLANAEIIDPLAAEAQALAQLTADAKLLWLHEAYVPSLQVYGVAKVVAQTHGKVQKLVDPIGDVFQVGRRNAKKKPQ